MNNTIKPVPHPAPRKRGKVRWVLAFTAVLLALLAAACLLFPRELNPDRVVRFFRYMGLRDRESYGRISFEGGTVSVFAGFDDGLLVGSENGLTLYSLDGEQKAFVQGALPSPVLRTGGDVSLLFSPGSSYAACVGGGGTVLMDGAFSGAVLNADVGTDGDIAYITAESGYKAVATVLNNKQEATYRFCSRTRFLNTCAVSEKGSLLALASLEEKDGIFHSGVIVLPTDEPLTDLEQEDGAAVHVNLGNQVIYELRFLDRSHILAVAQNELVFLNTDGERLSEISLLDNQMIDYSVSQDGWVLLALNGSGSSRVLSLNADGKLQGELELPERVLSVSAAGNYAAVLTDLYLQTCDRRLTEYDRSQDILGATRVVARSDGTALLILNGVTKLMIP